MDDALMRAAALMGAAVPAKIKKKIIAIAQDEYPKKIAILQLGSKYQARYNKEFRPETYGFKTPNELLKTIPKIDLHYDELLELWFLEYNPDGEDVGEDQQASSNGESRNDQKMEEPVVETNGTKRKMEEEEEAAAPLNASEGKKVKTEAAVRIKTEEDEEAPVLLVLSDGEEEEEAEEKKEAPVLLVLSDEEEEEEAEEKKDATVLLVALDEEEEEEAEAAVRIKTDAAVKIETEGDEEKKTASSMASREKNNAPAIGIKPEGEQKASTSSIVASKAKKKNAPAIGIDLGTTYSVVAVHRNKRTEVFRNLQGEDLVPSYVAYTKDECLVGTTAKIQCGHNAINTIYDAKRLIGRRLADDAVQAEIGRLPFQVVEAEKRLKIQVSPNGIEKSYLPEQVSAMVLRKMKKTAEVRLGTRVTDAVITVPAYFNDTQRQATKDAAAIAGLNVLLILNEPTAAAIAYGLLYRKAKRNVLVFDLGGGTLDVTVLEISGRGLLTVKSTAGDTHLGGEDFDNTMVDHFVKMITRKYGRDISNLQLKMQRLRDACERAKRILSDSTNTTLRLDLFDEQVFSADISRVDFERWNGELFDRTLAPVKKALCDKGMTPAQIDEVVLVGGSTRIPKIKELLGDYFGEQKLIERLDADMAVADGAAIYAAIMNSSSGDKDVEDIFLVDVTPFTLGIDTHEGIMDAFVHRNAAIPTTETRKYTNPTDGAPSILIQVLQGEAEMSVDNVVLGEFTLMIPKAKANTLNIQVEFKMTFDGILRVSAVETSCGVTNCLTITNTACRHSKSAIARMAREAELLDISDERSRERLLPRHALEEYCYTLQEKFENSTHYKLASVGDRKLMLDQIEDAIRWTNDEGLLAVRKDFEQKREQLDEAYKQFIAALQGGDGDELPTIA